MVRVAVPTGTVSCPAGGGSSKMPPDVEFRVRATLSSPLSKLPSMVSQRWPVAPTASGTLLPASFAEAKVNQAPNTKPVVESASKRMPWPRVSRLA